MIDTLEQLNKLIAKEPGTKGLCIMVGHDVYQISRIISSTEGVILQAETLPEEPDPKVEKMTVAVTGRYFSACRGVAYAIARALTVAGFRLEIDHELEHMDQMVLVANMAHAQDMLVRIDLPTKMK